MNVEDWNGIRWFRRLEFLCPHCQREEMDIGFLLKLSTLREQMGKPLIISSGWRCPQHNAAVSETGLDGPHTTGHAADIAIAGASAFWLVARATILGFSGIGVKQTGEMSRRFIHLDDLTGDTRPRIWSY